MSAVSDAYNHITGERVFYGNALNQLQAQKNYLNSEKVDLATAADLLDVSEGTVYLRHGDPPAFIEAGSLGRAPLTNVLDHDDPLPRNVKIDAPVRTYVPEFNGDGTAGITVRQLLTHTSGLRATLPLYEEPDAAAALQRVFAATPIYRPGTRVVYSDLNAILLGESCGVRPASRWIASRLARSSRRWDSRRRCSGRRPPCAVASRRPANGTATRSPGR